MVEFCWLRVIVGRMCKVFWFSSLSLLLQLYSSIPSLDDLAAAASNETGLEAKQTKIINHLE